MKVRTALKIRVSYFLEIFSLSRSLYALLYFIVNRVIHLMMRVLFAGVHSAQLFK